MPRYITIHGHFYQPPRENPWLEAVEVQDSARPYHDWNERITAECYLPNATSRILGEGGFIEQVVNNYSRISFNFGSTLLSWLASEASAVYAAIIEADRESQKYFGGHGSALSQVYNHIIMPLANERDKRTQVVWGMKDFKMRFGRDPEGMWLAETAVDLPTLEVLAGSGVKFTILAQHQAQRMRKIGAREWMDVSGGWIDFRVPYRVNLPSGKSIAVFFYDGQTSRAVAFEGLLKDGALFARRIAGGFDNRSEPQLAHIATDGESYGHHHKFGDMALAFALKLIEKEKIAKLTNYGEFLEIAPPEFEVEIVENSAWSCAHGIERWRSNCGCNTGGHPGWQQKWRTPLRESLDWLRDKVALLFEREAGQLLADPWTARDDYITVILERTPQALDRFLAKHAKHPLSIEERIRIVKLLGMQRHALLMFTSCGWFFDDIAGIETIQDLQYAARTMQLVREISGVDLEEDFLRQIENAPGNRQGFENGRVVYNRMVKGMVVDLPKVVAHWALMGLFDNHGRSNGQSIDTNKVYSYSIVPQKSEFYEAGKLKLTVGKVEVSSIITGEFGTFDYCAFHTGDHNMLGGALSAEGRGRTVFDGIVQAFLRADVSEVVRLFDRVFEDATYGLGNLFKDGQRRILRKVMQVALADTERLYRRVYEEHAPTMRFLSDMMAPVPPALLTAASFVLNRDIKSALKQDAIDIEYLRSLVRSVDEWNVPLDREELGYVLTRTLNRLADELGCDPTSGEKLSQLAAVVAAANLLPIEVNLYKAQTCIWRIGQSLKERDGTMKSIPDKQMQIFIKLAGDLRVKT